MVAREPIEDLDLERHSIVRTSSVVLRPLTACFLGVHEPTETRVFVKVLHSESPGVARNFLRELEILRALNGRAGFPELVAASAAPPSFHACRYITDPTFAQKSERTGLSLLEVLTAAGGLSRWIARLHEAGYAHRDLSPDHAFVRDDESVTVVDFGMAKDTGPLGEEECRLAQGYDVVAWGMIAWEAIMGQPVFPYRERDLAATIAAELEVVRGAPLPAPVRELILRSLSTPSELTPEGFTAAPPLGGACELERSVRRLLDT